MNSIMRHKKQIIKHQFPLKSSDSLALIKSEHPDWEWEVYDYRGLFISYLSKREIDEFDNIIKNNK
jgi:hypothetical protein